MALNSTPFLLFILPAFFAYWAAAASGRNSLHLWFLLAASYFFYAASGPWSLVLLLAFTIVNFFLGLRIDGSAGRPRKAWCALAVGVSLSTLAAFKYLGFIGRSLDSTFGLAGLDLSVPVFGPTLTLGISFYTFSAVAYAVDVYREKFAATRSLRDYALYLAFFPKIASGPIARPAQLLPQFAASPVYDHDRIFGGFYLILFGLFKKVMVADLLASLIVDPTYKTAATATLPGAWLTMWAYSLQIFCDFSGYTDMAIGCARLLGLDLPENFNRPYLARDPQEFWRRWHITLSTWLRDYLYIPLGGSRHGPARTSLAIFVTMMLGGLWHGAAWTFVFWGAYHGLLLAAHRLFTGGKKSTVRDESRLADYARIFLTFNLVGLGWIFFRAPDLETAFGLISRLIVGELTLNGISWGAVLPVLALGMLLHNLNWPRDFLGRIFVRLHPVLQGTSAISLIAVLNLFHSVSDPFIYLKF